MEYSRAVVLAGRLMSLSRRRPEVVLIEALAGGGMLARRVTICSNFAYVREGEMPITERTPQRLIAKSGSTTLILSKETGNASLQRKLFNFWKLKPSEVALPDIADVTVDAAVDRASGVDICNDRCSSCARAWAGGFLAQTRRMLMSSPTQSVSFWVRLAEIPRARTPLRLTVYTA